MRAPPPGLNNTPLLDRMFRPQWAGGWVLSRLLWAWAALLEHGWRVVAIEDAYTASDMVFTAGPYRLVEYLELTHSMGYALWAGSMLGIAMVAWGGRLAKPGLVLWAVCAWTLISYEALSVKAYDRLMLWVALGLLFGPIGERHLANKYRSPSGRWVLMIVFCSVYGSTGFCKALYEPSWFGDGSVLAYHFLHPFHAALPVGVWLSDKLWLVAPMAWVAVTWEASFPFLIWFKRLNPWILVIGLLFHFTLVLTMTVGTFPWVALSAYPVLLHPELARQWWGRIVVWWSGRMHAATARG